MIVYTLNAITINENYGNDTQSDNLGKIHLTK